MRGVGLNVHDENKVFSLVFAFSALLLQFKGTANSLLGFAGGTKSNFTSSQSNSRSLFSLFVSSVSNIPLSFSLNQLRSIEQIIV